MAAAAPAPARRREEEEAAEGEGKGLAPATPRGRSGGVGSPPDTRLRRHGSILSKGSGGSVAASTQLRRPRLRRG